MAFYYFLGFRGVMGHTTLPEGHAMFRWVLNSLLTLGASPLPLRLKMAQKPYIVWSSGPTALNMSP